MYNLICCNQLNLLIRKESILAESGGGGEWVDGGGAMDLTFLPYYPVPFKIPIEVSENSQYVKLFQLVLERTNCKFSQFKSSAANPRGRSIPIARGS